MPIVPAETHHPPETIVTPESPWGKLLVSSGRLSPECLRAGRMAFVNEWVRHPGEMITLRQCRMPGMPAMTWHGVVLNESLVFHARAHSVVGDRDLWHSDARVLFANDREQQGFRWRFGETPPGWGTNEGWQRMIAGDVRALGGFAAEAAQKAVREAVADLRRRHLEETELSFAAALAVAGSFGPWPAGSGGVPRA